MLFKRMGQIARTGVVVAVLAITGLTTAETVRPSAAWAQGVPTIDGQNTLQTIKQLEAMLRDAGVQADLLSNAVKQVEQLQAQLTQLQDIYGQFSGTRNIVDMAMGQNLDGILNGNMTNVLGTIQAGMSGDWSGFNSGKSDKLTQAVNTALSTAGLSQETVTGMASSGVPAAERVAAQASSGAVLAATAEQTYAETASSLERVNTLVEMTQSSVDIKESIDLNTRMLAELSVQLAKSLELQSIEAVYNGQAGVLSAATIAEERAYMTFSNE
ncbi:type IV secretion system protein [Paracoccus tibetensis]|jgi:type IV secretion system protein VirB5|uniref:Type IV secretion system protein VirB5 n=1 Tax=Paracoccus tibetensis TaxID=336292 RepID=A0A1G5JQA7_9RHOB|nr:type IV secretion system protein [Paracoccus tibetensis]SCY90101.1 type IV secretion system protein VirB5 [Paracoccus tibetensis]